VTAQERFKSELNQIYMVYEKDVCLHRLQGMNTA